MRDNFILEFKIRNFSIGQNDLDESAEIYTKANKFIEKWSKVLRLILAGGSTICLTIPFVVYGYFVYFTTDSETDAFYLPFIIW